MKVTDSGPRYDFDGARIVSSCAALDSWYDYVPKGFGCDMKAGCLCANIIVGGLGLEAPPTSMLLECERSHC